MKRTSFTPELVENIPRELQEGILYISKAYLTAMHSCFCGCGEQVVTPLGPEGWEMTEDGESVSLSPSIGNYHQKCKTHYWLKHNEVMWC